jgi:hypothetical protein
MSNTLLGGHYGFGDGGLNEVTRVYVADDATRRWGEGAINGLEETLDYSSDPLEDAQIFYLLSNFGMDSNVVGRMVLEIFENRPSSRFSRRIGYSQDQTMEGHEKKVTNTEPEGLGSW